MSFSFDQISAYLAWLDDRGLRSLPPYRSQDSLQASSSESLSSAPPLSKSPETETGEVLKLRREHELIVLSDRLSDPAKDMVQRIVNALGFETESYLLFEGTTLSGEQLQSLNEARFVLALGAAGAHILKDQDISDLRLNEIHHGTANGAAILLITHPDAMLAQPQLKVKVWEALQKLKQLRATQY